MTRDARFTAALAELGHELEPVLTAGGNYITARQHGDIVYVAGQIPKDINGIAFTGRVGADVSVNTAQKAAALCALRALAAVKELAGSLDRIDSVLRLSVFIQSTEGFAQHSEVGDGASNLLTNVLGDAGRHPRTSVGMNSLPKNVPVEIDMTVALKR